MKRNSTRVIAHMALIAFTLIVGCSNDTPSPSDKNNKTQNSNTQNNKPSTEENKDTTPPATETDKEETVITVPEWAKDRSYRNHKGILHFNELGIPNLPVTGDISITEATDNKLVITAGADTITITKNEDGSITINDSTLYPDVDGPEWLKGKAYQGMIVIAFDGRGILEYIDTEHKLSHISNITDDSVDIVLIDEAENSVDITIQKHDPTMETIKLIAGGQEAILAKAVKITE